MSRLLLTVFGAGIGVFALASVPVPDDPGSTATRPGSATPLVLRLSTPQKELRVGETPRIRLTIANQQARPVMLVQPGDGSESGWRTPIVRWSVVRVKGSEKIDHPSDRRGPKVMRCGNINRLKNDEVFVIEPNQSKDLSGWAGSPALPGPGTYSVIFFYSNAPDLTWKGVPLGRHDPEAMLRVKKSFKCTLRSNEVRFIVKEK